MTDRQDWWQPQNPRQAYGQQRPQEPPWQAQQYDPRQHQQRLAQPQERREQRPFNGYQPERPQYPPPQPTRHAAPPETRQRPSVLLYVGAALVTGLVIGGAAGYALHGSSPAQASAGTGGDTAANAPAAAQPDTAAGVKAAATQFYALYSASQWGASWASLAPSVQSAVPEATWVAVHAGCPGETAGLARVIKSVTFTGTTAVVSETVAGTLGNIATASDAWTYADGRWGLNLPASSTAIYKHGSVKADLGAAKAAGDCGS